VAGLAAFGVQRWMKRAPTLAPVAETSPADGDAMPADDFPNDPNEPAPRGTAPAPRSAPPHEEPSSQVRSRTHPLRVVAPPVVLPTASAAAGAARKVRFNIYPPGASFFLDGLERQAAGAEFELKPGPHKIRLALEGSPCCVSPRDTTVTVDEREQQTFSMSMEINPASIVAKGPAGGTFRCNNNFAGVTPSSSTLSMNRVDLQLKCDWSSPDGFQKRSKVFRVEAGKTNVIDFSN
ncbi:MAG TPA: hypothetical protein VHB21_20270, partial [Minicystis sp.]|nr:hypothetical protein [Minicystis sp.]